MLLSIIIGLTLIGITVTIQGFGTTFWSKHVVKNYAELSNTEMNKKAVYLLILTSLFLLFLNFCEAGVWAMAYYFVPEITEFESFEKAIYFSLVTFTTLGYGDITIDSDYRLLSGFEAMNGILLLGWSTTMIFSVMQLIWDRILKIDLKK